jgi:hypothetical protein
MLDETKPHRGRIEFQAEWPTPGLGLGYRVCGRFLDHERFAGREGMTSYLVAREGREVETANSRYTLVVLPGEEVEA